MVAVFGCGSAGNAPDDGSPAMEATPGDAPEVKLPPVGDTVDGAILFRTQCAPCHGETGAGDGPESRHLYPKPRNLRADKFRLVTNLNGVASRADLRATLIKGIPGTSMQSWSHLSEQARENLLDQLEVMVAAGRREWVMRQAENAQLALSPEEVQACVSLLLEPGKTLAPPAAFNSIAFSEESIERGRQLYFRQNCHQCHGQNGRGDGPVTLFDDHGYPARPRDLAYEPFKGGHAPADIYARLLLGMPGTPMPSSPTLSEKELLDLVHYCQSLSQEPKLKLTNRQRSEQARSKDPLFGP